MTQLEVADAVAVHLDTYKKWEKRGAVPLAYLKRYADVFKVSIAYLVTGSDEDVETPTITPKVKVRTTRAPRKPQSRPRASPRAA